MISVIDYGAGNLLSVKKALDFLNIASVVSSKKEDIEKSDAIILPGVGAFPDAMESLNKSGLVDTIKEQAKLKPFLGICLGMQLLFQKSFEFKECEGLGLINGEVKKIGAEGLKIPHMGWNDLKIQNNCPLLDGINEGDYVYFVHSFKAVTDDKNINAFTIYGEKIPALVSNGNIYGAQFHPEKSSEVGLKILKNFGELI
jgi:glutamine amidotransferase